MTPRRREYWGLTLSEVLLAFTILLIAILSVVAAFSGALLLNSKSVEIAVATEVGRDFLERVKEMGYDAVPEGSIVFDGRNNDPPTAQGFPPAPYPNTVENGRQFEIKAKVDVKGATLKVVMAEVFWDEHSRIVLETYVYPGSISFE